MKHFILIFSALLISFASFAVPGPIAGVNHVCVGSTTTLSDGTTGGTWSSRATTIATVGSSTGVVTGILAGTTTITYTVGASYVTLAMTVNALPILDTIIGGGSYCIGSSGPHIGLSGSTAGVNYQLYNGSSAVGGPISGTGMILDFGIQTAAGIYTIIATNVITGCSRTMALSVPVIVNALPATYTLYTPGSGAVCSGAPGFIYLSGSQTGVNYQLNMGGITVGPPVPGTGSLLNMGSYSFPGIYTAVGINASTGCMSTMSGAVTLSILPSPGPIIGPSGVCAGSSVTLTDTSAGGAWTSSNPAVATIGTSGHVIGVTPGTTTIKYTAPSGCWSAVSFSVTNLVLPITGSGSVCVGLNNTLSDASVGGTWTSSNTAIATVGSSNGIVTGIAAGTAVISYTVGGTCGYVSKPVTVNSAPAALTGITSVCAGGTTSLACTTTGGVWSSNNTAVATVGTSGIVTTIAGGSATISYTLPSGCKSSAVISVDPPPVITGVSSICVGNTTTYTTSIAGSWTSSNPFFASISPSGIITGLLPGSAIITCTSFSTGCVSNHTISVTSSCTGTPAGGTANAVNTNICAGQADLLYLTGASSVCGVTYQWQSSTDSIWWTNITGATNDSIYAHPQTNIYYRCKVTCYSSSLFAYSTPVHVIVYNSISAHSIINTPSYFCNGPEFGLSTCGIQPGTNILTFYGDGTSDSTHLFSYSTDSSANAHIYHAYNMAGTYTVKQILRNGIIPQDSIAYTFNYNYCRTLPVFFYFDTNNDCVDDYGDGYPYHPVTTEIDSAGIPVDTITTVGGFYYKALGDSGTVYRFKVISHDTGLHMSCPTSGILYDTITAYANNYPARFFGFNCTTTGNFDMSISAYMTCARHIASGYIDFGNDWCTVENAVVTMTFSPNYVFGSSSVTPYSIVGNTVTWHINGLNNYTSHMWTPYISFNLNVPGPFLTAGDTIQTYFSITPLSGDINPVNNYYSRVDTIMASYDPNGINVSPQGEIIPCTPLQYAIRFENTGNDTAHNISVIDTLPDYVDARSLKLVSSTSVVNLVPTTYSGHNVVKFDFPHINLPDSSHHNQCFGEVIFTVKAKAGLADGSVIMNHASIYFDDNLPVLTDTATNIIGINPIIGPGSVCLGSSLLLSDASANGVWSASNTAAAVTGGLVSTSAASMDTISYTLSNSCLSRSATHVVTINPVVAASVTINSNSGMGDTICTGTTPVFTASTLNGGPSPVYQWSVDGINVGTDSTYIYVPLTSDTVSVMLASNAQCVTPDTATATMVLTVLSPIPPIDSMIASPGAFISAGVSDTFLAIITNGVPVTYEWLLNGLPTGDTTDTFITSTLNNGDSVTCITTSTGLCHLSSFNSFIITVSNVAVSYITGHGSLVIYPNPNKGAFTIKGSMSSPVDEEVTMEITDMIGQMVFSKHTATHKGLLNENVSINKPIPNGMYILTLHSVIESSVYHFIIEE